MATGVSHEILSRNGFCRLHVDRLNASQVYNITSIWKAIYYVSGPWGWKSGDELGYVRRILKEAGVNAVDQRVIPLEDSKGFSMQWEDMIIVIADDPDCEGSVTFIAYAPRSVGD